MKKLLTAIFCLFFLGIFSLLTNAATSNENEVIFSSLKNGSSKDLAKFFENGIELNINGNQGEYSKNQAELVIRDFFKKYPPENFEIIHEGFSGDQIKHYIGTYTSLGESYRILLRGKQQEEEFRIYSLEIIKY
ncbi:DUF4783 domain-containing protein [Belliella sp. DSM 107340]|uniref:DUF4783 domain-containing protein n=1 Tax=Belliella calami TaxID=2923436 RepID=A0ABS9UMY1_9BACT|nr:DUF4783 domain-containing protein [Belliella calami]MCH7397888.1 DUF4783 domain-containing protein [Belliella calami]